MVRATGAMHRVWGMRPLFEGVALEQFASDATRGRALMSIAGWARTQFTLKSGVKTRRGTVPNRLQYALLKQLASLDNPMSVNTFLLELLPAAVLGAWHNHPQTVAQLKADISYRLRLEDFVRNPKEHRPMERSTLLRNTDHEIATWDRLTSRLRDWEAQEMVRHDFEALLRRALLSPREAEVMNLRRQRLTQQQISAHLAIPRDQVKTHENRALGKMRRIARL